MSRFSCWRRGWGQNGSRKSRRLCTGWSGCALPLALAITAARAAARPGPPLAALAGELGRESDRLDAFDTGEEATSVRAVFSWSYRQLTESAARMFRLLGLHPGPDINLLTAASLAGLPVRATRRALAELTAASLLSEHVPGRYALHDLLRAYAAEQARQVETADERRAAIRRALDYYLHTGARATLLYEQVSRWPIAIRPPQPGVTPEPLANRDEATDWYQAERRVLIAVTGWAAEAGFDVHGWQIPWVVRTYLYMSGYWQDWAAVSRIALASAGRLGDHSGLGWAHIGIWGSLHRSGAYDDAVAHGSEALSHFHVTADLFGQGVAHHGLAVTLTNMGRRQEALGHAEQALALGRAAGDRLGEAYALAMMGVISAMLGDPSLGTRYCRQAVALHQELGDPVGTALALDDLARAQRLAGDHRQSIASYQQVISMQEQAGNRFGHAHSLIGLGDAYDAAGHDQSAREAWRQALDVLGDLHHPDAERARARLQQQPAG